MTVYDLIKSLVDYDPQTEVFAEVGNSGLKFEVGGVDSEYHNLPLPKDNRAVIVLDPW